MLRAFVLLLALLLAGCGGAPRDGVPAAAAPLSAPLLGRGLSGGALPLPVLYRVATGGWYYLEDFGPGGPVADRQFRYGGDPSDVPVGGDFDGDGVLDVGLYRRAEGKWFLVTGWSGGQPSTDEKFTYGGDPSDIPLTGDFDGDGDDEPALYRSSNQIWYVVTSRGPNGPETDLQIRFGGRSEDVPVVGDFNGDGRSDLGNFTPTLGLWNLDFDLDGRPEQTFWYGGAGDLPVAGDFDGDGDDDPGLYRPSTGRWYLLTERGPGGAPVADEQFAYGGHPSDLPLVGDFDGDGTSDPGVYRRATGGFDLLVSRVGGQPSADYQFLYGGDPSDLPLTSAALLAHPGATLEVTPGHAALSPGKTLQLQASRAGTTWASSNPSVATVDASGMVTTVAPGFATIHAWAAGLHAEVPVGVRRVLYTMSEAVDGSGTLTAWQADEATGQLDALASLALDDAAGSIGVHPSGGYLYLPSELTPGLRILEVDARTGALEPTRFYAQEQSVPGALAVRPDGSALEVGAEGATSSFLLSYPLVDGGAALGDLTSELTLEAGALSLTVAPTSSLLAVLHIPDAREQSVLHTFRLDASGAHAAWDSAFVNRPRASTFDALGRFFYHSDRSVDMRGYVVQPDLHLANAPGSPYAAGDDPDAMLATDRFLFALVAPNVLTFAIGSDGSLTLASNAATGSQAPEGMALLGGRMYVVDGDANALRVMTLDPDTGALADQGLSIPVPGGLPEALIPGP